MSRSLRALPLLLALLLGACGESAWTPEGQPSQPEPQYHLVAETKGKRIQIFDSPGAAKPRTSLDSPNEYGAPRVFLVRERQDGWLYVLLPVRPNGSKGWIKESDVNLSRHAYRIRVELSAHRITVWNGNEIFLQEPAGVGRANAPTPSGEYYITELLRPPARDGVYGPYAFGLSGFSNVFESFAGGPGTLGLHGTNEPAGLGKDVSAGCIRISNAGITKLATVLPLGTPVEVVP